MANEGIDRRKLLTGVGAATAGLMVGAARDLSAQAPAPAATAFQPARHAIDAWLDKIPGKHRVVLDSVTANGAGQGIGYSSNVFNASRTGYQLENADMAVVLCLRHDATAFAFNNAMWAKYGKVFTELTEYKPANGYADVESVQLRRTPAPGSAGRPRRPLHRVRTCDRVVCRRNRW